MQFQGFSPDVIAHAVALLHDARKDGGGTYTREGGEKIDPTGYVVGGNTIQPTLIIPAQWPDAPWGGESLDGFTADAVASVAAWLSRLPRTGAGPLTIGIWRDADGDGRVYLDVVDVLDDREEAIDLARQRNELSIYDASAGETIDTSAPVGWDIAETDTDDRLEQLWRETAAECMLFHDDDCTCAHRVYAG